jgi:hypothetical protein
MRLASLESILCNADLTIDWPWSDNRSPLGD